MPIRNESAGTLVTGQPIISLAKIAESAKKFKFPDPIFFACLAILAREYFSLGHSSATNHDWGSRDGLQNLQKDTKRFDGGFGNRLS
jgi:hypothetical protein